MSPEARYPEWPTPDFSTREAAIAHAMSQLDPGDEIEIHQESCSWAWGDCDCEPEVWIVPEARA